MWVELRKYEFESLRRVLWVFVLKVLNFSVECFYIFLEIKVIILFEKFIKIEFDNFKDIIYRKRFILYILKFIVF